MSPTKFAITTDQDLLAQIDRRVEQRVFPNRSQAIQDAIQDKLNRINRSRLARERARLDPREEQALAEEDMEQKLTTWPP
jgi:metal-responsive CopG/Arc/MetJ family transcriptional regulator